ncbi:hypothetical protein MMC13_004662 [Lambiella insularis]|nr:hypothetical protein [Lambiella insularis]
MDLPAFNADILSSLTQKIESNLKKPASGATKSPAKTKSNNEKKAQEGEGLRDRSVQKLGKKRTRDGRVKSATTLPEEDASLPAKVNDHVSRADGDPRIRETPTSEAKRSWKPNSKVPTPSNASKSQKSHHDRRSRPPAIPKLTHRTAMDSTAMGKGPRSRHEMSRNIDIKEEALALGGTKEDVELVKDAGSDSEIEGPKSMVVDGKLLKELRRLAQDMGIREAALNADAGPSEGDQVDEEGSLSRNEIASAPRIGTEGKMSLATRNGSNKLNSLTFMPRAEWHTADLPGLATLTQSAVVPQDTIDRVHEYALQLLEAENIEYGLQNKSASSAHQFYSTIMSAGTLSDKISALTLSVQESPLHNMKAFEALISLARKRSRGQAVEVLGALKDLLGPGSLLPSDRKLRTFATQPGLSTIINKAHKSWTSDNPLPAPLREVHLVFWAFEDWLKTTYFEILKILETWCNDEIVFARGKAVDYVYELLRDKPEQESNLLRLLVNKLGDSDKKIASKTSYNIIQLETSHPLMKPTIISSIESDLLFRPGQSMHAKYYAVITLNQTVLSAKEETVAKKLLEIYFSLFVGLLAKPEPVKPAASATTSVTFNKKGERQGGGGAPGKRAQQKQASETKTTTVHEEYREKMISAVLTGVNRAMPYTKTDDESFDKQLDTLFRVTHSSNFNTSIQALMLIQQLCGSHQAASDRFYRTLYESLLDPRLPASSKQALYLNLLFRALRADLKVKRVEAFAKRLLQVTTMHQPPFACAVIYLLRELEAVFPNLQTFIDHPEEEDSDDEEAFRDVVDEQETDQPARAVAIQTAKRLESRFYAGRKREPEYSNAEKSCLWEITPFLLHYHPSVALFASRLLTHEVMPAKPDLSMHTLVHFLDRFVYRNPKKSADGPHGTSIMQPLAGGDPSGLLVSAQGKNKLRQPVNTEAFWKMDSGKVNADEVFFHKYFSTMGKGKESAKKKKAGKSKDVGEESEGEENEDEIWEALVSSRPELEGEASDNDIEMDDLDSALESGMDEDEGKEPALSNGASDQDGEDEDLDFGDDDEALIGSDAEVPSDLDEAFKDELQFATENAAATSNGEKAGKKRKRLKNLPTFASVEDYAAMLDEEGDEDKM